MDILITKEMIHEGKPVSHIFSDKTGLYLEEIAPVNIIIFKQRKDIFRIKSGRTFQFMKEPEKQGQPVKPQQPLIAIMRFM